jgi:hypothetical protein
MTLDSVVVELDYSFLEYFSYDSIGYATASEHIRQGCEYFLLSAPFTIQTNSDGSVQDRWMCKHSAIGG